MKIIFQLALLIIITFNASAQNPYMLSNLNSTPAANNVSFKNMGSLNGQLYYMGQDAANGAELWKTDGTQAGTLLVKDINAGAGISAPDNFFMHNNLLYFVASDGVHGLELWKTDGTTTGTVMVKDIKVGSGHSRPINFTSVNSVLFFIAETDFEGYELWKTDGTTAGTVMVKDIWGGSGSSFPSELININGTLFFSAQAGDIELYKTDGTAAGTVMVKNINLTPCCDGHSIPQDLTNVNGTLYFTADDGTHGREIWISNGTTAGTVLMFDIIPGSIGSNPTGLTWVNETSSLYYAANDGVHGTELFSFNQLGNGLEADINPTGSSNPANLININGVLYFSANDGVHGIEPWQSDFNLIFISPTTTILADINVGLPNSSPINFKKINNQIYFSANDGIYGNELWQTDGTEAGTLLAKDCAPGITSSNAGRFTKVNIGTSEKLYFTTNNIPIISNYYFQFWSLGNCTPLNSLSTTNKIGFNQQNQISPASLSCHCDILNNLVTSLNATGANPISGNINSQVWIEPIQPINYVKRHYQITPNDNAVTATAKVTLYFTQQEFTDFNALNTIKLPISPADGANNKANLLIEKSIGISSNNTGLPASYATATAPITINPVDADITYNSILARWQVSFNVTGFSGFFVKTISSLIPNIYTFNGNGEWNNATNWVGGIIPPTNLTSPNEILINPVINGECVLPITNTQTIANGAKITVVASKKLRIGSNLIIQ